MSEILASRIAVFEVELDLSAWPHRDSGEVPGFADALVSLLPSTREHKCMSGEAGGFHAELRRGTNFGHVIEHVLLELIRLADGGGRHFTGWTKAGGNHTYVIHYGAPDFLTGRLAATLAVELVKRLVRGEPVVLADYLETLRQPVTQFACARRAAGSTEPPVEPECVIHDAGCPPAMLAAEGSPALTADLSARLAALLAGREAQLAAVARDWRLAFFEYGGTFARGIVDKVELLNLDRFPDLASPGGFDAYLRGVRVIGSIICSYRVPLNFLIHATWLYKNHLILALSDESDADPGRLVQAGADLDALYRLVAREIAAAYPRQMPAGPGEDRVVRGFRELQGSTPLVVVADEDDVGRRAVQDILEFNGHRVLAVRDGRETLRCVAGRRAEVGLVVLDDRLRLEGGSDLRRRLRALYPEVALLVTGSRPLDPVRLAEIAAAGIPFLARPFRTQQLLDQVRRVLAARERQPAPHFLGDHI